MGQNLSYLVRMPEYGRGCPAGTGGHPEPLKSSVTGPSFLVNCYLEIKFYKKIRVKKRMF